MAGLLPIREDEGDGGNAGSIEAKESSSSSATQAQGKLWKDALVDDRDDSESEEDGSEDGKRKSAQHGKSKAAAGADGGQINGEAADANTDGEEAEEDSDEDESDEDESETAELLRELEKIKRERAEEKARQEREAAANSASDKEAQAATGNPLLNLKAALNQNGNTSPTNSISASSHTTSFSVKRRWDDDVIFKNQARNVHEKPKKEFVNDLLRTEFHRRFLKKFIA